MIDVGNELREPTDARLGWLTLSGADLLDQAEAFDVWTPDYLIRDLLRAALVKAADPSAMSRLCHTIAARTHISQPVVSDLAMLIARNLRLRPTDPASQLAKRLLRDLFADGSALISTIRGELHGYDGRMWRPLPDMELERLLMELVLTRCPSRNGQFH